MPREIDKTYGVNLDNDGKQISFVLKIKKTLPQYIEAIQSLHKKEYMQALEDLKIVLAAAPGNQRILRLLITTALTAKQYNEAAYYIDRLESKFQLSATDILNKGCLQSLTHRHDEAIDTYTKVLRKNRHNLVALNNLGYELIEKGDHIFARKAFEKAIKLNPTFDAAYASMGYLLILQDDLEAGKGFIKMCLELNKENAYAYKALSIYYLKLKDIPNARINFNKANELNNDIDFGLFDRELKQLTDQDVT